MYSKHNKSNYVSILMILILHRLSIFKTRGVVWAKNLQSKRKIIIKKIELVWLLGTFRTDWLLQSSNVAHEILVIVYIFGKMYEWKCAIDPNWLLRVSAFSWCYTNDLKTNWAEICILPKSEKQTNRCIMFQKQICNGKIIDF